MTQIDLAEATLGRIANQEVNALRIANQTIWDVGDEPPPAELTLVDTYYVPNAANNTNPVVTPEFTPAVGELLVVKLTSWSTDNPMSVPVGGDLTYVEQGVVDTSGFHSWAGIYTAVVDTSAPMTISSEPLTACYHAMTVERWSNAVPGAVATALQSSSGLLEENLTTFGNNSVVSWCAVDIASQDPTDRVYLSDATEEGVLDGHVGSNEVMYFAYQQAGLADKQPWGMSAPAALKCSAVVLEIADASSPKKYVIFPGIDGLDTDGPDRAASDSTSYTLGLQWRLGALDSGESNPRVTEIHWVRPGLNADGFDDLAAMPEQCCLFDANTQHLVIGTVPEYFADTSDTGWITFVLTTPIPVDVDGIYRVGVYFPGAGSANHYAPISHYFDTGVGASGFDIGPVHVDNQTDSAAFGTGQGSYVDMSSFPSGIPVYPGDEFNSTNYGIGFTIETDVS